jgi:uncharacterized tellurite resistance protein B-like protein
MFSALQKLLSAPAPQPAQDLRLSVAILLLEAARQDDVFDARERAAIETLLTERFDLTPAECLALIQAAQSRSAQLVQLHGTTTDIVEGMSPQERVHLIEMLWDVAYADGVLDPEEDLLIRRIAGLIHVSDRDRVLARQRVMQRKNISIL